MRGDSGYLKTRFPDEAQKIEVFAGIEIRFLASTASFLAILDGKLISRNSIQAARRAIGDAGKKARPIRAFTLRAQSWHHGAAERLSTGPQEVWVASFRKSRSRYEAPNLFDADEQEIRGEAYEWEAAALAELVTLQARAKELVADFERLVAGLRKLTPERIRELQSAPEEAA